MGLSNMIRLRVHRSCIQARPSSTPSPQPLRPACYLCTRSCPPVWCVPRYEIDAACHSGTFTLDFTLLILPNRSLLFFPPPSTTPSTGSTGRKRSMMIVDHAILHAIGFFGLLPLGVLIARWTRTFTTHWFTGYAVVQAVLSGPLIGATYRGGCCAEDQRC
ncbi:hypothetical protein FIBSPDRAFT_490267 [Athelia psychrophila]|uniref:Cytochrome b561 domain-containing protein n=1 Tax=Athelia psychrophila TaxID=1759441 RepID=A0A166KLI7_9AGAM|nr:hypothetical protein FIBSPDRAFT_490267 [Fibularhizoctonia sp. CBS 109695]